MKNHTIVFILMLVILTACSPAESGSTGFASPDSLSVEQTLQARNLQGTIDAFQTATAAALAIATPQLTEAPTLTPAPQEAALPNTITPGEPPMPDRTLQDADSRLKSKEGRTLSGDNILDNLYERPFTTGVMTYQPDLDILTVDFSHDDAFFYFTIHLSGINPDEWAPTGTYGIEFDRTKTGKGDLLVMVTSLAGRWSTSNVTAYQDQNNDVGGLQPILADEGFTGNGYDQTMTMSGDQAAFARVEPGSSTGLQIAVSRALLRDPKQFLWGAWADNGLKDVSLFDYNDAFTPYEAGSPIRGDRYPIKALYNLDNTCRLPYGFNQAAEYVKGMCELTQ